MPAARWSKSAASDDACGSSGFNSSTTVSGLTVGDTYYIQIGAWSAATVSTYTLEVDCFFIEPCDTCVDGSTPEGEPILVDGDDDITNGGCNSDPDVFGSISIGENRLRHRQPVHQQRRQPPSATPTGTSSPITETDRGRVGRDLRTAPSRRSS